MCQNGVILGWQRCIGAPLVRSVRVLSSKGDAEVLAGTDALPPCATIRGRICPLNIVENATHMRLGDTGSAPPFQEDEVKMAGVKEIPHRYVGGAALHED